MLFHTSFIMTDIDNKSLNNDKGFTIQYVRLRLCPISSFAPRYVGATLQEYQPAVRLWNGDHRYSHAMNHSLSLQIRFSIHWQCISDELHPIGGPYWQHIIVEIVPASAQQHGIEGVVIRAVE